MLSAVFVSAVASIWLAAGLKIDTGFDALLPSDNRYVSLLRQIPQKIGGMTYIKIAVQGDDPVVMKRFADVLKEELLKNSEIDYVRKGFGGEYFKIHALWYMKLDELRKLRREVRREIEKEKLKKNPLYVSLDEAEDSRKNAFFSQLKQKYLSKSLFRDDPYLISRDRKILFLLAKPRGMPGNIKYARKIGKIVRAAVARATAKSGAEGLKVDLVGPFRTNVEEYAALVADIFATAGVSLLLLLCLFYFHYRDARLILWIVSPTITAVLWAFALAKIFIGSINTQTAFLAAILLGLVVDFSIHLASGYVEERRGGADVIKAIEESFKNVGPAVAFCAATTFAVFVVLVFTDLVGFKQFGFIAAVGVMSAVMSNLLVLPSVIVLTDRGEARDLKASLFSAVSRFSDVLSDNRRIVRFAALLLAVAGVAGWLSVGKVGFEYNLENLRSKKKAYEKITDRLDEILGHGVTPSAVFLTSNMDETCALEKRLKEMSKKRGSTILDVKSACDLVPANQKEKAIEINEIVYTVKENRDFIKDTLGEREFEDLEQMLAAKPVDFASIPDKVKRRFADKNGKLGTFVFVYSKNRSSDMRRMLDHAREVKHVHAGGRDYYSTGESIIFSEMLSMMRTEGARAVSFALAAVVILSIAAAGGVSGGMLIILSLAVGLGLLAGCMAWFSIKLNFFNIVVFPMILGIGVDSSIHLYLRNKTGRSAAPVMSAVILSALTTMIGFSSLLFASNRALVSIGLLAVTGVALCLVSAIFVMSAVLKPVAVGCVEDRKQGKQ